MKKTWLAILVAAVLCVCGCAAPEGGAGTAEPSQAREDHPTPSIELTREEALSKMSDIDPPDFTLEALDGSDVALSDYRGKIVFLCFWQTWCGPCEEEMPLFQKMIDENDDIVVLAVNDLTGEGTSTAEEDVRAFIEEKGYSFPVLLDRDGAVFNEQEYRSRYIPANYVIDRDGILRVSIQGAYTQEMLGTVLDYMRALDW